MNRLAASAITFLVSLLLMAGSAQAQENSVEITVSTSEKEASVLMDYFKSNDYEIRTDNKSRIVAEKKTMIPKAPVIQKESAALPDLLGSEYGLYVAYGLGGGLLILGVAYLASKLVGRQGKYRDEYYYETYQEFPYKEAAQVAAPAQINLANRLGAMNAQPQAQFIVGYGMVQSYQMPVQGPASNWIPHLTNNNQFSLIQQMQIQRQNAGYASSQY